MEAVEEGKVAESNQGGVQVGAYNPCFPRGECGPEEGNIQYKTDL